MFSKGNKDIQRLLVDSHSLSDLSSVIALLSWDQEVNMPSKGGAARAKQLATLSEIFHNKLISLKLPKVKTNNIYDLALIREMTKAKNRAKKIPTSLIKEFSETISLAQQDWQRAKKMNKFEVFAPSLKKVIKLKLQMAKLLKSKGQTLYDVMLDEFEPGLSETEISLVFNKIKIDLSKRVSELKVLTQNADKRIANKKFEVGTKVIFDMGYDLAAGRIDRSAHPFTTTFDRNDVRITTWENKRDFRPKLYATIHEAGHALYEQGLNPELDRLYLGEGGGLSGGVGMAMHESQSRLWENMIGRSEEFCNKYLSPETFKVVNVIKPSPVRVEADEVSYGLHIIIRFEIERELINGQIKVEDLPKIWREKYKKYLGIIPKNDAEGTLQDIHWAHGAFGYFPNYFLGSLIASQLLNTAKKQIDIYNFKLLREWLRKNIHQYGRIYTTKELLLKITVEDLNPRYFLDYIDQKFTKMYNLSK